MPGQWTNYQMQVIANTTGLQPVRDVITGNLFIPQFEGQRTALDVSDAADVAAAVADRYAGDLYMNTGRADVDAYYAELEDTTGVPQEIPEDAYDFLGPERQQRKVDEIMAQISGGGANPFMRTARGLENWRAKQPDAQGNLVEVDLGKYSRVAQDIRYEHALSLFGEPGSEMVLPDSGINLGGSTITVPVGGSVASGGAAVMAEIPALGEFAATLATIGIDLDLAEALWAWGEEKMTDASYPIANILIDVYDQPAFKQRFPAIEIMRGMEDVTPVTPAEYIVFEKSVMSLLTRFSIGGQALDFDGLITKLLSNNVGDGEVEQRLIAAHRVIGNVPESIKQTYMKWYEPGVVEENLMKTFLDPTDEWGGSWADVQADVGASEVGGWARIRLGLDKDSSVTKAQAEAVDRYSLSQSDIWSKLDAIKATEELFTEKLDEVVDFTVQEEGFSVAFGLDEGAREAVTRRRATRAAEFGGGGGAMITGSSTGFGAANA
jgi:hypothetical protein